jgi:aspartate racemase|tara:strand:+ start:1584 stop:2291 length:708 start_codon:yes stop_codon:yes gene_type:complete
MIGILGGMGTQAGLDFSTKLAKLYRGKLDQKYPLFVLYNKSNVPKRLSQKKVYKRVYKSLLEGCIFLQNNNCKFITIPCNTAHHWYDDLIKRVKVPILSMPKEVFAFAKKNCSSGSKIGILATESTLSTRIYHKFFEKKYKLIEPSLKFQKRYVNKSINLVKKGKVKEAEKIIKPVIRYLLKMKCKKIILACTELPVAIFAFKSFKKVKSSRTFFDPNLILAKAAMKKYSLKRVK